MLQVIMWLHQTSICCQIRAWKQLQLSRLLSIRMQATCCSYYWRDWARFSSVTSCDTRIRNFLAKLGLQATYSLPASSDLVTGCCLPDSLAAAGRTDCHWQMSNNVEWWTKMTHICLSKLSRYIVRSSFSAAPKQSSQHIDLTDKPDACA